MFFVYAGGAVDVALPDILRAAGRRTLPPPAA